MNNLFEKLGVPAQFDANHSFVTSPLFSPFALAIIRLTLGFYTLFTAIFVLAWEGVRLHTAKTYFSFFTELSYIGLCAYFCASGVQTLIYALSAEKKYPLQRWAKILQFLHVLLFSTISTFPIIVTVVFWSVLASPSQLKSSYQVWSNVSQHALNTVFILFEVFFTYAGPSPWIHIPFVLILLASYLGVAYITHATQGFYTYSFLDPQKQHAKLAGWIIGIAAAGAVVFSVVRMLCVLRNHLAHRWERRREARESTQAERLDEWETIERYDSRSLA